MDCNLLRVCFIKFSTSTYGKHLVCPRKNLYPVQRTSRGKIEALSAARQRHHEMTWYPDGVIRMHVSLLNPRHLRWSKPCEYARFYEVTFYLFTCVLLYTSFATSSDSLALLHDHLLPPLLQLYGEID